MSLHVVGGQAMIETRYIDNGKNKDGSAWEKHIITVRIQSPNFRTVAKRELYLVVSKTQIEIFKTRRGAEAWLKRMGAEL
jgi:hypothetical protein